MENTDVGSEPIAKCIEFLAPGPKGNNDDTLVVRFRKQLVFFADFSELGRKLA